MPRKPQVPQTSSSEDDATHDFVKFVSIKKMLAEKDSRIKALESEVKVLKEEITSFKETKDSIDDLEQYSRRNSLRISGIREQGNENRACQIVCPDARDNQFEVPGYRHMSR